MTVLPESSVQAAMAELESAEDFLEYFEVAFDPAVVQVYRLHILQRFHDYLKKEDWPEEEPALQAFCAQWLQQAYQDFVNSDAKTEKVFKVFRNNPQEVFVPLDSAFK
ncbi:MAG: nitrogenase-stabilizing/protective protein NifW [Candidatus Competibacteraceae bacterium]|jgi:nitrogenase-stabilizing/protective protein|nr:nitrogenase-stabilizing/protective protein NifW [Candidatus Competibacteraceae bacterium]